VLEGALPRLDDALSRLRTLSTGDRRARVEGLCDRLAAGRLRIFLLGEAKRGKSTLANALLGRPLLPVGVTPVTAISTTVVSGTPERADIRLRDGAEFSVDVDRLPEFVSEAGNAANARRVDDVVVFVESELPANAMELVDTPGVGSVYTHNSLAARQSFETMDVAVVVVTADPPISASERALLKETSELAVRTYVVLNKTDRLTPSELDDVLAFTVDTVRDAVDDNLDVICCSARDALAARANHDPKAWQASGVSYLVQTIEEEVRNHGNADLRRSIASSGRVVVESLLDEVSMTLAILDASVHDREDDVRSLDAALEGLQQVSVEASALITLETDRLRRDLDADASTLVDHLVTEVQRTVEVVSETTPGLTATTMEDAIRDAIGGVVRERVEVWRSEWLDRCDRVARSLAARTLERVDAAHQGVREAAQRLSVRLESTMPDVTTPPPRPIRYEFGPTMSWDEPLTSALRRFSPRPLARRRVRARLREASYSLVDKHVGRTRSTVQVSIAGLGQRLQDDLSATVDALHAGLADALARGRQLGAETALVRDAERLRLVDRDGALRSIKRSLAGA
jgi:GTPase Era involved in 16S rRNA processing